jgi:hypothetical protein
LQKDGFLLSFAKNSEVSYSPSRILGFKQESKKASSSDPEVGKQQLICLNQYQLLTFEKETIIYMWSLEGKKSSQVLINMILSRKTI